MSGTSFIAGDIAGVAIVTDRVGKTGVVSGIPINDLTDLSAGLAASLVTDADAFYAPGIANVLQFLQLALAADDDGFFVPIIGPPVQQTLLPALVADGDTFPTSGIGFPPQTIFPALWTDPTIFYVPVMGWGLLPPLYTDQDIFYVTAIAYPLLPALVTDSDSFLVPVIGIGTRTLLPPLVVDTDAFFSLFVTLVGLPGGPLQKLKAPPKITDNDVIFAPRMSMVTGVVVDVDIIRAPVVVAQSNLLPGLVPDADTIAVITANIFNRLQPAPLLSDDAVYIPLITMILQPALKVDGDGILSVNVGWKLFGQPLIDVEFFPAAGVRTYNELLPEVWRDEETIDTYPFFLQQVQGGIPVLPREGVLTGSIKQTAKLTGSITKRRLVA